MHSCDSLCDYGVVVVVIRVCQRQRVGIRLSQVMRGKKVGEEHKEEDDGDLSFMILFLNSNLFVILMANIIK